MRKIRGSEKNGCRQKATHLYVCFRSTPHPLTVTTRIITFLVGNPDKPSFATVTGWGVDPMYVFYFWKSLKDEDSNWTVFFWVVSPIGKWWIVKRWTYFLRIPQNGWRIRKSVSGHFRKKLGRWDCGFKTCLKNFSTQMEQWKKGS